MLTLRKCQIALYCTCAGLFDTFLVLIDTSSAPYAQSSMLPLNPKWGSVLFNVGKISFVVLREVFPSVQCKRNLSPSDMRCVMSFILWKKKCRISKLSGGVF